MPASAHVQTHHIPGVGLAECPGTTKGSVATTAAPLRRMAQPGSQISRTKMARVCLSCHAALKPGR